MQLLNRLELLLLLLLLLLLALERHRRLSSHGLDAHKLHSKQWLSRFGLTMGTAAS